MFKLASVALLALISVSCLGSDFEDSIERSWQLTSGRVDGAEIPIVATHPITISFDGGEVDGTAACNGYGGQYALSGSSISFESLAFTEMACSPQEVMDSEQMYADAITRVERVVLDNGLVLRGTGVELVFEAVEPDAGS